MKRRLIILLLAIIFLIASIILYYFMFNELEIVIPCIFYSITGLYCPGCGITRMIFSLIKFDFYQAFRYNPLMFVFSPFILIVFIDFIIKWLIGRNDHLYLKISNKMWIILLVITLLFGVIRNIPFFDYLIPTVV